MCDCIACKMLIPSLIRLGFSISDTNYHADIIEALSQCKLVTDEIDIKEPVTFEDKGLRAFIQENFAEYFKSITLTDEELDQFKRHLEASIGDWISENWRDFMDNRGD